MEFNIESELQKVLVLLEQGKPEEAQKYISGLFEFAIDCEEIVYTNKCCTYWVDSLRRLREFEDPFERCDSFLTEWKNYQKFISKEEFVYEPAVYSVQKGFFTNALKYFSGMLEEKDSIQRSEMYRKTGICYKKLGNYETARDYLIEANNICPNNAAVIAELADCYCLCGEDKIGKVLFREAFFLDPALIDLDFLDSELIKALIQRTKEKGFSGKVLHYWIPVYGVLLGIFNIKRDLNSQEVARLKKNIYAMENEYKDPSCNEEIIIPKLLNSYFWQIDHYNLTHEPVMKINEILLKIKILDSSIYEAYIR
ncbi:MAG: hypothetical protein MR420_01525 [Spirochaetia bacterium]|nr:hypothetical protein [Spirochaetia bacterium]